MNPTVAIAALCFTALVVVVLVSYDNNNISNNISRRQLSTLSFSSLRNPTSVIAKSDSVATADENEINLSSNVDDSKNNYNPTLLTSSSSSSKKNRRKFVSYTSSEWEKDWLEHVTEWTDAKAICDVMMNPASKSFAYMHDFLNATCTSRYEFPYSNWCVIDDEYRPMYYNTANRNTFEIQWVPPQANPKMDYGVRLEGDGLPKPFTPELEHIFSKFVFYDEVEKQYYTEYIEPLVSHLRFPLAVCLHPNEDYYLYREITFRGWIMPPSNGVRKERKFYFDAGASDWEDGAGGPSLKYFYNMWKRHDILWDQIYAYEMTTTRKEFYDIIPQEYANLVNYQQCPVSSSPQDDSLQTPFLPLEIQRKTNEDDYVLLKLDIDSPRVEQGTIDYILEHNNNGGSFNIIDEIFYEHHILDNYLMSKWWGAGAAKTSMEESYRMFLNLRLKGIRAHSWI